MFLIHNEQTKLSAAWLNALATALVAAGTFASFASLVYGFSSPAVSRVVISFAAIVCFVGGIALHLEQGLAREIARMTAFEIFAVAWIPAAVAIVIGFVFSLGWLEDRAERRRARHAAEYIVL
jgi:hypothetical protein